MRDYISLVSLDGLTTLEVLSDRSYQESPSLFETIERDVYPDIKERLNESVNTRAVKDSAEFQKVSPEFTPLIYSENPVTYNTFFFPCEAYRHAYLLVSVHGKVEKKWYKCRFDFHQGPVGSNDNGPLPSFQFTCFNQPADVGNEEYPNAPVYLWPLEIYEVVSNSSRLDEQSEPISIVYFVDWRFFLRGKTYTNKLPTTNDRDVVKQAQNTEGIVSVYKTINEITNNLFDKDVAFGVIKDYLVESDNYFKIKSLEGCSLGLAIDTILAYHGIRLYGGRLTNQDFVYDADFNVPYANAGTQSSSPEEVSFGSNVPFPSIGTERFKEAVMRLSATPTETRVSLFARSNQNPVETIYGVFTDVSSKSAEDKNSYKSNRWLQNYHFFSVYSHKDDPLVSSMVRINLVEQVDRAKWQYIVQRVVRVDDDFLNGWCFLTPGEDGYNTLEENNYSTGRYGNGVLGGGSSPSYADEYEVIWQNGTAVEYQRFCRDEIIPLGIGSIYEDTSGRKKGIAYFSGENATSNNSGIRKGTLDSDFTGYGPAYITYNNKKYIAVTSSKINPKKAGETVLFYRDPDSQRLFILDNATQDAIDLVDGYKVRIGDYFEVNPEDSDETHVDWIGMDAYTSDSVIEEGIACLEGSEFIQISTTDYGEKLQTAGFDWKGVKSGYHYFRSMTFATGIKAAFDDANKSVTLTADTSGEGTALGDGYKIKLGDQYNQGNEDDDHSDDINWMGADVYCYSHETEPVTDVTAFSFNCNGNSGNQWGLFAETTQNGDYGQKVTVSWGGFKVNYNNKATSIDSTSFIKAIAIDDVCKLEWQGFRYGDQFAKEIVCENGITGNLQGSVLHLSCENGSTDEPEPEEPEPYDPFPTGPGAPELPEPETQPPGPHYPPTEPKEPSKEPTSGTQCSCEKPFIYFAPSNTDSMSSASETGESQ